MRVHDEKFVVPADVSDEAMGFIRRAHALLAQAKYAEPAEKLEYSMQAAMRTAGAVLSRRVVKRRRQQAGVWARLRAQSPENAQWSEVFEGFMPLREDVRMGLNFHPDEVSVARVHNQAVRFLEAVEASMGVLPAVA